MTKIAKFEKAESKILKEKFGEVPKLFLLQILRDYSAAKGVDPEDLTEENLEKLKTLDLRIKASDAISAAKHLDEQWHGKAQQKLTEFLDAEEEDSELRRADLSGLSMQALMELEKVPAVATDVDPETGELIEDEDGS